MPTVTATSKPLASPVHDALGGDAASEDFTPLFREPWQPAMELLVQRSGGATRASITQVQWRGMRCRVTVQTNDPMVRVDLRLNWKQPATSVAASVKDVGLAGEASIAVADDANEGAAATVVVLDAAGNVLDRKPTTIGEAS